jgi:hypothetical protein
MLVGLRPPFVPWVSVGDFFKSLALSLASLSATGSGWVRVGNPAGLRAASRPPASLGQSRTAGRAIALPHGRTPFARFGADPAKGLCTVKSLLVVHVEMLIEIYRLSGISSLHHRSFAVFHNNCGKAQLPDK